MGFISRINRRLRDERGQGLVEYALIISVVSLGTIAALVFLRGEIRNLFTKAGSSIQQGAGAPVGPIVTGGTQPTAGQNIGAATGGGGSSSGINNPTSAVWQPTGAVTSGPAPALTGLQGVYSNATQTIGATCTFQLANGFQYTGVWIREINNDFAIGATDWEFACLPLPGTPISTVTTVLPSASVLVHDTLGNTSTYYPTGTVQFCNGGCGTPGNWNTNTQPLLLLTGGSLNGSCDFIWSTGFEFYGNNWSNAGGISFRLASNQNAITGVNRFCQ